ncbi:MAG: type 4a pilus biogenesis protein PilO [Planctomycetaceae bacterium]|nr:type 4a pilus biogenesis protein PilO [Planctomycetaceae bacterium]
MAAAPADPLFMQRMLTRVLGLLGVGALLGLWWFFLVRPLNEAQQLVDQERIEVEGLHMQQPVLLAALKSSQERAESWKQQAARLQERSKPAQDDIDFLDWINEQATTTGLVIKDFRPSGRELVGEYEGRGLMLSTSGSFESIGRFLEAMRQCPRMNRITSIDINPEGGQRESFLMSLRVVLFTRPAKVASQIFVAPMETPAS